MVSPNVIIKVLKISRVMIVKLSFSDGNRISLRNVILGFFFLRKGNGTGSRQEGLEVPSQARLI